MMNFLHKLKVILSNIYLIPPESIKSIIIIIFFFNGLFGYIVEPLDAINIIINSLYLLIAVIEFIILDKEIKQQSLLAFRFIEFVFALFVTVCEIEGYNVNADRFILPAFQIAVLMVVLFNDAKRNRRKQL